jgi:3-hydroxyacyl-CoA dehydrogenase
MTRKAAIIGGGVIGGGWAARFQMLLEKRASVGK